MNSTDHDEFDVMAVGWALHALEPAEEDAFAEHLESCDRCQQLVLDSKEVLGDLAYDVPLLDPPPQVLDRIRHEIGADDEMVGGPMRAEHDEPPDAPVVPLRGRSSRPRPRWLAAAIAAAVVLVALLAWNIFLQGRVDQAQRIAAQRESVINQLGRSSTRAVLTDDANNTVGYVVQRGASFDIVASGLAPNDRERTTYVLWALHGSGDPPEAVGTFDVVRASMDVRSVSGRMPTPGSFTGLAVSKETGRHAPQRPSQVVATGAVLS